MAGYIGKSQSVILTNESDTLDDVTARGATTTNNVTVGNLTSTGIDDNASATAVTLDASGNVGIGGASGKAWISSDANVGYFGGDSGQANHISFYDALDLVRIYTAGSERIRIDSSGNVLCNAGAIYLNSLTAGSSTYLSYSSGNPILMNTVNGALRFGTNNTERMRIDSSGNLLVGKTSSNTTTAGFEARSNGQAVATFDGGTAFIANRKTSDGDIAKFMKDGTTVGSIGSLSNLYIGTGDAGLLFRAGSDDIIPFNTSSVSARDNAIDLGDASFRFDDIFATNGTIQTSDRNEKQDIEELSEAEQRVAVAAKALMRKFRWKDAVAEKGDDARIHFGIIAQDLQAAFEAEGLDAGRYAMFISSTWWEHDVEVPAVEAKDAVLDEEGNVIEEAVEAQEAYTRTDTYETAEEAPEGAVERTRLGVRYSELLAFIIAAI